VWGRSPRALPMVRSPSIRVHTRAPVTTIHLLLGGLLLAVTGCAPNAIDAAGSARVDLWLDGGELGLDPDRESQRIPLLREDFHLGARRWMAWSKGGASGMLSTSNGLAVGPFAGDGIELGGRAGGISILIPVEPGMTLGFRGESWEGEFGRTSSFSIVELENWPQSSSLCPDRVARFRGLTHTPQAHQERARWTYMGTTIRLQPETNAVLLTCLMEGGDGAATAQADLRARFRDLALDAIPIQEHWDRLARANAAAMRSTRGSYYDDLAPARERLARSTGFPSRAARTEFAHRQVFLGPDKNVPGLVLLPGESVSWRLRIQHVSPRLSFGLSTWDQTRSDTESVNDGTPPNGLTLRIGDVLLAREELTTGAGREVAYALSAFRGARVTLTLTATGTEPIAIARPVLGPLLEDSADGAGSQPPEAIELEETRVVSRQGALRMPTLPR
jgi:hypothetical protein